MVSARGGRKVKKEHTEKGGRREEEETRITLASLRPFFFPSHMRHQHYDQFTRPGAGK
jgi:hypothetical protein